MKVLSTKINELTFILTKECNLNCSYCSQKNIKNRPDINKLKNNFNKVKLFLDDFIYIDIFGGEPLLYKNQVKELIGFLRYEEKQLNKNFKIRIFSNGTIPIEDLYFYKVNNIVFSISYDGLQSDNRSSKDDIIIKNLIDLSGPEVDLLDKVSFSVLNPSKDFLIKNYQYIAEKIGNFSLINHYLVREPYLWNKEGVRSYLDNFDRFISFSKVYKKCFNEFPFYIQSKLSFFGKNKLGCESGINRFTISDEILDCGVINFKNEFFSEDKNYIDLYKKECSGCEIEMDCDKKCPKYFLDHTEIFKEVFCTIKKYEVKKIKELEIN